MKSFSIILSLILALGLKAQTKYQIIDTIQLNENDTITDFMVDEFNNLYYISGFNVLKKRILNQQGQNFIAEELSFTNRTNLTKLNVQNPLEITIKSSFFNLLVLDNRLQPIQDVIQFPLENNFSPTLTYLIDTNYLWGYDPVLEKLILWDYQDEQIFRESVIITDQDALSDFKDMFSQNLNVYLVNDEKILVFDSFANLSEVIPFEPYEKATINGNKLIFFTKNKELFEFDLISREKNQIKLKSEIQHFSINNDGLFVLNKNLIYIYKPEQIKEN